MTTDGAALGEMEPAQFHDPVDLQRETGTWAEETFQYQTDGPVITHLIKEVDEFLKSRDPVEAADIVLILMHYAHRNKFDLLALARMKFEQNQLRKWGPPGPDGVIEHVRDGWKEMIHCPPCGVFVQLVKAKTDTEVRRVAVHSVLEWTSYKELGYKFWKQ